MQRGGLSPSSSAQGGLCNQCNNNIKDLFMRRFEELEKLILFSFSEQTRSIEHVRELVDKLQKDVADVRGAQQSHTAAVEQLAVVATAQSEAVQQAVHHVAHRSLSPEPAAVSSYVSHAPHLPEMQKLIKPLAELPPPPSSAPSAPSSSSSSAASLSRSPSAIALEHDSDSDDDISNDSQNDQFISHFQAGIATCMTTEVLMPKSFEPPDFDMSHTLKLTRAGEEFNFTVYSHIVFQSLRSAFGMTDAQIKASLCGELKGFGTNSKSGSLFYRTADKKFIIKSVTKRERDFLEANLKRYYDYIMGHPYSLLTRFLGLYSVEVGEKMRHVLFMPNVFQTSLPIHERYDLKGSTVNRETSAEEKMQEDVTLKDLDFKTKLYLGSQRFDFWMRITEDSKFLEAMNVMDYSLLVGVHYQLPDAECDYSKELGSSASGEIRYWLYPSEKGRLIYFMGVIDFLQEYTLNKKLEHGIKGLIHHKKSSQWHSISAVSPSDYCHRFMSYISTILE